MLTLDNFHNLPILGCYVIKRIAITDGGAILLLNSGNGFYWSVYGKEKNKVHIIPTFETEQEALDDILNSKDSLILEVLGINSK